MQCQNCGSTLPLEARFCPGCGARLEWLRDGPGDAVRDALEKAIGFQYRIERLLGRGGMGAVYLAHELALDRDVAIKVLPPEFAGAPELRERFRREARTAARLNHPNIVPLYTFGEVDGLMYFVMGYVSGESLAGRLRREGPLPPDEAYSLLAEIADGLSYAHRRGVIHRDIKPDNILIDAESGSPRLTDFGIAKAAVSDAQLTMTGQLIGTPAYMSPEQAFGSPEADARSDIYSLGVVAYEMVSGRLPFDAKTPMDSLVQRLKQEPRPLGAVAPHLPDDLISAIHRCLERDPAERWPDARTLQAELAPSEDETEDPLPERFLRMGIGVVLLIAPTLISAIVFSRLNPGAPSVRRLAAILMTGATGFLLLSLGATATLLRQGFGIRTIVQAALRQPRAWKFWYPRPFRRRGDVWDRLPTRIRRVRLHFALILAFIFGIFVPVSVAMASSKRVPAVTLALEAAAFLLAICGFFERHRTTKHIAATLGISSSDASKIMSTPAWRRSAWQRGPAASLIRNAPSPLPQAREHPTVT